MQFLKINNSGYSHIHLLLLISVLLCSSCKEEGPIIQEPTFIEQSFPIVYNAEVTEGKLPYPHHNPDINQAGYEKLIDELFVINNYGLYQGNDEEEGTYFHDALDIILPNGTPIFAVDGGIVRANIGGNQYYRTLVIEDLVDFGYGWGYTHIYDIAVKPGDIVSKGQFLGVVNFLGLDHIHLNRLRIRPAGSWNNFSDLIKIYPDDYFTLIDTDSPLIKTPFHYFNNNGNIPIDNGSEVDTINGDIDIVVSMRDIGAYAGANLDNGEYWGDRLAVRNIHYRILKDGVEIVSKPSFDFRKIEFEQSNVQWKSALTMYKHRNVLDQDPGEYNMFYSHYIITHARENLEGTVNPSDANLAWDTNAISDIGEAMYPNGLYEIEVTAFDTNGNERTKSDFVYVKNE